MKIMEKITEKREEILCAAAARGARNVRVFGSVAKGEEGPDSDIDILVEMDPDRTLLDLAELFQDLADLLGRRVEIVTESALRPPLRRMILKGAVPV